MQAKRIAVLDADKGVNTQSNILLQVPTEPREQVNMHNIWAAFSCEPIIAGANAQGNWVLYIERDAGAAIPNFTDSFINTETRNIDIIACGVWGASNESVYTSPPIHPTTSRNLPAGGRLIFIVHVTGVTSGNTSIKSSLCAHTVRK